MSPLSDQSSLAGKSDFEAQLGFFNAFFSKCFETTESLLALNMQASRAAIETSAATLEQFVKLLASQDSEQASAAGRARPAAAKPAAVKARPAAKAAPRKTEAAPVTAKPVAKAASRKTESKPAPATKATATAKPKAVASKTPAVQKTAAAPAKKPAAKSTKK